MLSLGFIMYGTGHLQHNEGRRKVIHFRVETEPTFWTARSVAKLLSVAVELLLYSRESSYSPLAKVRFRLTCRGRGCKI